MELEAYVTSDTAIVELYSPTTGEVMVDDQGKAMTVEVYGRDSAQYKRVDRDILSRNIQSATRKGKLALDADQLDAQNTERVAKCVKAWNIQYKGEVPATDYQTVRGILEQFPWLREQVETAITDRARFLTESSAS